MPWGLNPEPRRATNPKKPVGSFSSAANWRRALVERAKLKHKRGGGAAATLRRQSVACCVTCDAKPQPTNRKSVVITEKRLERVKSVGASFHSCVIMTKPYVTGYKQSKTQIRFVVK